ncbi:UvrD-helicase domain-containing protein [Patescibacteria group bacterium AH-259-L05]|nr:UvrD-helicase domain-containing protein [Patescibacteria group bacterium AH-259-L05]
MDKKLIDQILQDLNKEQTQAVTHGHGPLLIIAGAGTGKTTVITRRVAYLILNKLAKPEEILAMTFTDKAAQEMEERVDKLLPYGYVDLWISTFHSFCQRILEAHAADIGLPLNFKVLDTIGQTFLVLDNFDKFDLDYYKPLGNPNKFIQVLVRHFSRAKDELISPSEYLEYAENLKLDKDSAMSDELLDAESLRIKEIAEAYHIYQQLLLENNALDFGDLINYTIELFNKRPQILEKYRQQFKYILVDEFQDTNWAQYQLLQMLAAPNNNITVVGDDKQAVYRWRGAAYNNVFQLKKDYPKSIVLSLVKNYRSRQEVLDLSYKFIEQNYTEEEISSGKFKDLLSKRLEATKSGTAEIKHLHFRSQEQEVRAIVEKIIELKQKHKDATWNDFAILVRANSSAEAFCQALRFADIPYQFLARAGLFSKPVILDILAYIKLLDNYHESQAVYRILTSPIFTKSITNEDLSTLIHTAHKKNWSLYEAIKQASMIKGLSKQAVDSFNTLLSWIEKHSQVAKTQNAGKVMYAFLHDSGYLKLLSDEALEDSQQSTENISYINQFFKHIENFEATNTDASLKNFSRMIDLMIQTGDRGGLQSEAEAGPESVKVSTVHSAKGLEWRWVFLPQLLDKRFPTISRKEPIGLPDPLIKEIIPTGDIHLQEERRLFYVALTRAKDGLFISSAEDYGGKTRKKFSRFLYELGLVTKDKKPGAKKTLDYLEKQATLPLKGPTLKSRGDSLKIPKKFSFSQFAAFQACPLQYKFAFILKVPRRGRYTFSFGQTIHITLRRFLQNWIEAGKARQTDLFSTKKQDSGKHIPSLDDLYKLYNESWIDEWYESKEHQKKYKEKGKKILKMFYEDFVKSRPSVKYLEKDFNIFVKEYPVKGKIDRVDERDDGLEIIDYKTGKGQEKQMSSRDKQQLLIYQLAAKSLPDTFDKKLSRLTCYYLENGKKISVEAKPEELEQIEKKIVSTIESIKTSDFPANPTPLCKHCDFFEICEYRYKG